MWHAARARAGRDPLQLRGHGGVVGLPGPLGLDELPDHHFGGLQPGHLGIDLDEFLAQPLGTVSQHHPLSSDVASVRPRLRTAALCKRLEPHRSLPAVAETLERTGR
jgi:hypothetical protein